MSRVYLVQNQRRRGGGGDLVAKFDVSPAREFGELVELLSERANPFADVQGIARTLGEKLVDYTEDDYLLLIGNPILIGLTVAFAAIRTNGRVRLLQWNGERRVYQPVIVDVSSVIAMLCDETDLRDDDHDFRATWSVP